MRAGGEGGGDYRGSREHSMNETSKCHDLRLAAGEFDRYLAGEGLDVGAGSDPITPPNGRITAWDRSDGDAQYLADIHDETFDFVYSSHCLEHLSNVPRAVMNWARVCKSGGYLYIVVPDWTLYEHRQWPSRHNPEHAASFSIMRCARQAHPHYTLRDMMEIAAAAGLEFVDARIEADGFDFTLHRESPPFVDQTMSSAVAQNVFIFQKNPTRK